MFLVSFRFRLQQNKVEAIKSFSKNQIPKDNNTSILTDWQLVQDVSRLHPTVAGGKMHINTIYKPPKG